MFGYPYKLISTPWQSDGFAWLPTKDAITGEIFWLKRKCVRYVGPRGLVVTWTEYTTEINAAMDKISNAH